jgi:hypothetical protein
LAIYSLHHSAIGRTTHDRGTAGAHVAYVTRRSAAAAVVSARMPVAAPGAARETRAWFDAEEEGSRKNARVADKLMLALPIELDAEQQVGLVQGFAEAATAGRAPWLAAIHAKGKDAKNPHCHLVIRDRDPKTGKRAVGLSEKGSTDRLRALWEQRANAALEAAGVMARIDRRSLLDQGISRQAEIHVGPKSKAMEARGVRPESRDRYDARGRAILWASEIDQGRSRTERRTEIVVENDAHAKAAKWADLTNTWEICAQQIVADQAEREATKRAVAEEAEAKMAESRRRLEALGVRFAAAFFREMKRIAELRKTVAGYGERLAVAARALLENHKTADALRAEEPPPPRRLDLEALRENTLRSIAGKRPHVVKGSQEQHQLELVRSRNRGRAPGGD